MKRPSFQFYPADWRKDAELQSCSVVARGLWHEAICIMHECDPYGELRVNGKPMSAGQLARLVGMSLSECKRALGEIELAGVSSRTDDGALYSRRMVRDERTRNARAEGGKGGAEHGEKGAIHGAKGGRPRAETGDNKPPLYPPPSSSTSSSSPSSEVSSLRSDTPPAPPGGDLLGDAPPSSKPKKAQKVQAKPEFPDWWPAEAWAGFVEMRQRQRKPATDRAVGDLIKKLAAMRDGGADPVAIIDQSITNCWLDFFPLRQPNPGSNNTFGNRPAKTILKVA